MMKHDRFDPFERKRYPRLQFDGASKRAANVCWAGRLGRLVKYNKNRSIAYVIWDGNRSFERVSVELIEPCGMAAE